MRVCISVIIFRINQCDHFFLQLVASSIICKRNEKKQRNLQQIIHIQFRFSLV